MHAYTDNPLDQALASATPVYPVAQDGQLPALAVGQHCFLLARNGIYVMGQGNGFHALIRLAELTDATPFGTVREGVVFAHAGVPTDLIVAAAEQAIATSPTEWAGAIIIDDGHCTLVDVAVQSASPRHITYDRGSYDDAALAVDLHSHGTGKAYFSDDDDASDTEGVHIAAVFGHCIDRLHLHVVSRVSVNGYFLTLNTTDWMVQSPEVTA